MVTCRDRGRGAGGAVHRGRRRRLSEEVRAPAHDRAAAGLDRAAVTAPCCDRRCGARSAVHGVGRIAGAVGAPAHDPPGAHPDRAAMRVTRRDRRRGVRGRRRVPPVVVTPADDGVRADLDRAAVIGAQLDRRRSARGAVHRGGRRGLPVHVGAPAHNRASAGLDRAGVGVTRRNRRCSHEEVRRLSVALLPQHTTALLPARIAQLWEPPAAIATALRPGRPSKELGGVA